MMYLIQDAELVRPNLWAATMPSIYLDHLSDGIIPMAPYSVIVAELRVQGSDLAFNPEGARLLCRGTSDDAIFLNSAHSEYSEIGSESEISDLPRGDGDEAFLSACKQLVSEEFALLAGILIRNIRKIHPGRLVEGQSRKWLNHPDNFVAITIQNRDRSLAVSIRDVPEAHNSELLPKRDRPGYLRFKISKPADLGEALKLISASARRS